MFASCLPELGSFSVAPADILDSNILLKKSAISLLVSHSLCTSQVYMIKEFCWFSQVNLFHQNFPHRIHVLFLPSQFYVVHIHRDEQSSHDSRISIPNLELFPNRVLIELFRIAFTMTVLPMDDHRDFAQRERLGQSCWTMILAICVEADGSRCLEILTLEFSIICEHLPI